MQKAVVNTVNVDGVEVNRLEFISQFQERKKDKWYINYVKNGGRGIDDKTLDYIIDNSFDYETVNSKLSSGLSESETVRALQNEGAFQ